MFRRALSLILVPVLLANQAVMCCAHTHVGVEAGNQSARVHIHQSGHSHVSGHHHHHGDSDDHRQGGSNRPEDANEIPDAPSAALSGFETSVPCGHDDDAIYLGDQVDLLVPLNRVAVDELAGTATPWMIVDVPATLQPRQRSQSSRADPHGLYSPDQCAIYLQTGCLRI